MMKASTSFALRRRRQWRVLCIAGSVVASVLAACGGSATDAAKAGGAVVLPAPPGPEKKVPNGTEPGTTYTVVNLDPANASGYPVINASNQVAFTVVRNYAGRAGFFNGDSVRDIGSFGGAEAFATGLNDAGRVVGIATDANEAAIGFRWSEAGGMVSLGSFDASPLHPSAVNRAGQVTGWFDTVAPDGLSRAFVWSDAGGGLDLGALGPGGAIGEAINDAGMVAGTSLAADGVNHAFAWSAAGMLDLGIYGGVYSTAHLVNNTGQVGGSLRMRGGGDLAFHGFVWSKGAGLRDIGTLGGDYSFIAAINDNGQLAGVSRADCGECFHAITWSADGGLADLGTLGGNLSDASGISRYGEVVGWAESKPGGSNDFRAFVWIKGQGMIDLNERIPNAPAGLALTPALAISERGAIVADSTAGLVLLLPGAVGSSGTSGTSGTDAPQVGPLTPEGPVRVGTSVAFAASFSDRNSGDRHSAAWSWSDGCGLDDVSKIELPGTVRASHAFCAPGEYWVSLKITDSSGRSTTVGRTILVYDGAAGSATVAGSGWFMSPPGACKLSQANAGRASFSFMAKNDTKASLEASLPDRRPMLRFRLARFAFDSTAWNTLSVAGGRARYQGSGTLNGAGNYRFMLTAVAGAAGAGKLGLKIWHVDPRGLDVVDYDNQGNAGAATAPTGEGSTVSGGGIVIRS